MSVPLFSFPGSWDNHPRCSSAEYYDPMRCRWNNICKNTIDTPGILLCTCHYFCQAHCAVPRSDDKIHKRPVTWLGLLEPYVNLSPTSAWNAHVLSLLTHAVNCVDPKNGLSPIHGFFLFVTGDKDLDLRALLEVGVDADTRYLLPKTVVNVVVDDVLLGGTALHFCVKRGFIKCTETLLDVGVQLDAQTNQGKKAVDLCVDGTPIKALLV
jgi:hypothetical protein